MKKEDFERLKAVCEKEGFGIQHFHTEETYHIWKKDIWDGVEFVECLESYESQFSIGKIYKIRNGKTINDPYFCLDNDGVANGFSPDMTKRRFKPSTEQAYIEQLKKECFERFGDIKEGDRFEIEGSIELNVDYRGMGFRYYKDEDLLCFKGYHLYKQGKWATRVKERVEVEMSECVANFGTYQPYTIEAKFTIKNVKDYDHANLPNFLRSQLEKYLNGEAE